MHISQIRSALYVPGHRRELFEKALRTDADCLFLDLEDSVPDSERDRARSLVRDFLPDITGKGAYVRVNGLDTGLTEADLDAVVCEGLDAVRVPKCRTPDDIVRVDELLSASERRNGVEVGSIGIGTSTETASAVVNCAQILSASPRVQAVSVGIAENGDLQRDLGYTQTASRNEVLYAMSHVLTNARALGIANIMAGPYAAYKDDDGLRREAAFASNLGFTGKAAIHPQQIPIINEAFGHTEAELDYFRRIVDAMAQAEADGRAATTVDGKMVDIAMLRRAEQGLASAGEHA